MWCASGTSVRVESTVDNMMDAWCLPTEFWAWHLFLVAEEKEMKETQEDLISDVACCDLFFQNIPSAYHLGHTDTLLIMEMLHLEAHNLVWNVQSTSSDLLWTSADASKILSSSQHKLTRIQQKIILELFSVVQWWKKCVMLVV